jgi:hypothetical protein
MKNNKTTANNPTPKAANLASIFSSSLKKTKDDDSFTLVSYRKNNGGMATRASRAKTNADNGNGNNKMMIASMSNFTKLQQDIFPIIELIARDSKNKDNSLVQTWMQAQTGPNKMTATSNFRCVSKALGLKDLLHYRQFLEALPNTVVCRIGSTAVAFFPAPLNILTYSEDRIFYSLLRILRYVASAG